MTHPPHPRVKKTEVVAAATACDTAAVERQLLDLLRELPLDSYWETPTLVRESVSVGAATLHLVGLHARSAAGRSLTASAAGDASSALERAYFELLERAATLRVAELGPEAPIVLRDRAGTKQGEIAAGSLFPAGREDPPQRHSLSNGVAAHRDWGRACRGAALEAIERDRILRSWFLGGGPPELLGGGPLGGTAAVPDRLRELASHDVRVHRFADRDDPRSDVAVCGVFLLPRDAAEPFCWGSGAGCSQAEAVRRAEGEALQRLGFLRGEPLPDAPPPLSATPDFHLDFFLHPPHQARIRRWLSEGMPAPAFAPFGRRAPSIEPLFADLTPPSLSGRVVVARVLDPGRMPLVFGEGHPWVEEPAAPALVHPIA